ncbi:Gluconolactonase [Lachnellula hyalina]|uniref:Gluconolactonase n=1 Tax=Lachnellula hyalina TaxID=1316788 RepID=A0A8H8R207_9HELO|nr:Gluconolactonase [Lachnellula hyalina]TVY25444.1 Gluconolactonase [Lachnellula hyalina]
MTTITTTDIPVIATQVQYTTTPSEPSSDPPPTHSLLLSTTNQTNNPFFHEACVYLPALNELYITSNLLSANTSSAYPTILISRIKLTRSSETSSNDIASLQWAKLRPPPGIDMPNGGVNYKDGILFCAQGSPSPKTGGLYYMPLHSPPQPIVTNFYGRDFNSVNDVVVSAVDGGIWFTDPVYGYKQGFRRRPELPGQVYRYDVGSGEVRVVAEGFDRCNGICFGVGETRLYVTDTGLIHGDGTKDFTRPATIYVFDVETKDGAPFLVNRRTFAFAASGVPDGIKCDVYGNVYAGCGDGVEVWNPAGSLIGRMIVPGGVANFCFGKEGELFLCNEQKLWRVQLAETTKGALLGI